MAQNIYDKPEFFDAYSQFERSTRGLAGAPEWPTLRAMLPGDLGGAAVVDLGCGFGWFCRWAAQQGAARIVGYDLSDNMLARARAFGDDPTITRIEYIQADLDTLELPPAAFDLAYSSLALHYVENFPRIVRMVHAALRPGGHFVFSIEHPILMAPRHPAWRLDAEGRKTWPLDGYCREGARVTDWLAKGVVKYHRTLATTLNGLIGQGFTLRRIEEFGPPESLVGENPELDEERERPMFLLVAAER